MSADVPVPAVPPGSFSTKAPDGRRSHIRRRASGGAALRRVTRASKRTALATKRKIWDTNDASIEAAETAVDHWEQTYRALRSLLVASAQSARSMYGAAKAGAGGIEHHLLLPVRDCVLLPAFSLTERAAAETAGFLQSEEAARLAGESLGLVRGLPYVGETVLAPALVASVDVVKAAWHIAQYPIPSKDAVRNTVDGAMTVTKLALQHVGREAYFYVKLVDATFTRTMLHTQWRVLGSGPYSTLAEDNKRSVIDHLCERYFSLHADPIARYELAAHIKAANRCLYDDLVVSGLLLSRSGVNMKDSDTWLAAVPLYRQDVDPLLLPLVFNPFARVVPLWFHLPFVNGKKPGKDAPWVRFDDIDRQRLEEKFRSYLLPGADATDVFEDLAGDDDDDFHSVESAHPPSEFDQFVEGIKFPSADVEVSEFGEANDVESPEEEEEEEEEQNKVQYETVISQWYEPDLAWDLLVDQKRHVVSLLPCCSVCSTEQEAHPHPPLRDTGTFQVGQICGQCISQGRSEGDGSLLLPPISMVMRPTLWRFHGRHTNEVRRAVWFIDTQRHGLQPYSEESAAILEDAYLFLKWHLSENAINDQGVLLTVQVASSSDEDEQQLVQFRSLTQVTAIQKNLGGAISIFKRRVYRGADVPPDEESFSSHDSVFRDQNNLQCSMDPSSREQLDLADEEEDGHSLRNEHDEKATPRTESIGTAANGVADPIISLAAPPPIDSARQRHEYPGESDDNVEHLVLVVHGIGEMLRSVDLFGMALPQLSTISDCCSWLRKNHSAVHAAQFSDFNDVNPNSSFTRDDVASATLGRVEYLPIEWHEPFAVQSQRHESAETEEPRSTTLRDVSLKTIPALRQFTNDTMLDVLYFMSPAHHDVIIDIVTSECNLVVEKFRRLTGFNGRISLLGHSLGSIIGWDILAHQMPPAGGSPGGSESPGSGQDRPEYLSPRMDWFEGGYRTPERKHEEPTPGYPQLSFRAHNFFMLGSPVAVFLMIRNQHRPLSDTFTLPGCSRVFNIFHPYDPVSYRMEPLLDPANAEAEPKIITHWKGGFRVQYQTKLMWRRLIDETRRTQRNVIEAVEKGMVGIGLLDTTVDDLMEEEEDEVSSIASDDSKFQVVHCGRLNMGRRIDYMLQEKEIENANEYVFALSAHSSYWTEKDLSLFIARQIFRNRNEQEDSLSSGRVQISAKQEVPQIQLVPKVVRHDAGALWQTAL